jgi:hypothetical protein
MTDEGELNIFACLDFIRDTAPKYAKAKADRIYLEAFTKSKRAILMKQVAAEHPSAAAQEREALAHPEYLEILAGLRAATEKEEKFRWLMEAARARIECWRSLESTRRFEAKIIP